MPLIKFSTLGSCPKSPKPAVDTGVSKTHKLVPSKLTVSLLKSVIFALQSCIVAIVVPDVDVIKCWASENKIAGTLSVLCAHPEVKQLIYDDMVAWGKEGGLKSFEQVRH